MLVIFTVVRQYGLQNIARKIWLGSLIFGLIHAAFYWYARYQTGSWGERMSAISRAFENRETLWNTVATVLGFPLELFEANGFAYFAMMVGNSILWGLVLSFIIVPPIVKK